MRALTWQENEHVEVTEMPDPVIQEPNDIIWLAVGACCARRVTPGAAD